MKQAIKYTFFSFLLLLCVFLDGCLFKSFRISFVICICFSVYNKKAEAHIVSALCGLLYDLVFFTLPYFSLIYLYISLGCVWCSEMFLGLNYKKVFLIGIFSNAVFFLVCYLINLIAYAEFFLYFNNLLFAVFNTFLAGLLSPFIYFCLKRLKF